MSFAIPYHVHCQQHLEGDLSDVQHWIENNIEYENRKGITLKIMASRRHWMLYWSRPENEEEKAERFKKALNNAAHNFQVFFNKIVTAEEIQEFIKDKPPYDLGN